MWTRCRISTVNGEGTLSLGRFFRGNQSGERTSGWPNKNTSEECRGYPYRGDKTVVRPYVTYRLLLTIAVATLVAVVGGCSLPGFGPTRSEMTAGALPSASGQVRYALVEIDPNIATAMEKWGAASLQGTFGNQRPPTRQAIGVGDSVQITIWEAAAGGLFSAPAIDRLGPGSRSAVIPEQVVGQDGAVSVPYAGRIRAAGLSPPQVEAAIVDRLQGKAIEPQALVTVTKNFTNTATVIGEVAKGARVPLTLRGDRILDVIALAEGVRAPANEIVITLMRGGQSVRVPMQVILTNPNENIFVMPGDVLTVARDPQTFTAAGAIGKSAILPFETLALSLDEAIAKAGGLSDGRADVEGVFVIRFEPAAQYDQLQLVRPSTESTDRVPVIYRLNLRDPNSFFMARRFPMRNKDILYVSSAPAAELQKIISLIQGFIVPGATVVGVGAVLRQ
jgi:polysaccharide export outer membrane protein